MDLDISRSSPLGSNSIVGSGFQSVGARRNGPPPRRRLGVSKRWGLPEIQWIGLRENLNRKPWFLPSN